MTPKKIALLTDSSADLRWDQARENNIFFVPLRILCEDGEYLDGVNITGPDIYQRLHNGELPQTIGGGIGQSRLCMMMIGTCHIGEVQASLWDPETVQTCESAGIMLL